MKAMTAKPRKADLSGLSQQPRTVICGGKLAFFSAGGPENYGSAHAQPNAAGNTAERTDRREIP